MAEASGMLPIVEAMPQFTNATVQFRSGSGDLQSRSFRQVYEDASAIALSFHLEGLGPGDTVAIHGDTSYEWLVVDLACTLLGAVSLALYPSAPLERVRQTLADAGGRTIVTDRLKDLEAVRSWGVRTIPTHASATVSDGSDIRSRLVAFRGRSAPRSGAARPTIFTIVSTSGTLSEPKLFGVAPDPLLQTMETFRQMYSLSRRDRLLLYLPLSHLPQRMILYGCLRLGIDIVLSSPTRFVADAAQSRATIQVTVPRVLEHAHARLFAPLRERLPERALTSALNLLGRAPRRIRRAVYGALPAKIFGPSTRLIYVGSAPTSPRVLRDLLAVGVPICEVYGTTEIGVIAATALDESRPGSAGRALPFNRLKLDPASGEILVNTPYPFMYGRIANGRLEPRTYAPNEYLSTGDVGSIDEDGCVVVRGRTKDFVALDTGEKVFVRQIENSISNETGAELCVIDPNGGRNLSALLFFNPEDQTRRPPSGSLADLCRDRIAQVNSSLHHWERVRSFAIIHDMPSVGNGCLTETMKVRRHRVLERYASAGPRVPV